MFKLTVIETAIFQRYADTIWKDDEREAFVDWIAENPEAGDVIPASGGIRKVRWGAGGKGKRSGARVIYYNVFDDGKIVLLTVYAKSKTVMIDNATLVRMKEALENG